MPEPKGEYQIPQTEFVVDQPEIVEASSPDAVAQYYDSLDRQSEYYGNRPAILAEEAERLIDRQELIAQGNEIHEQRRAAIENRLIAPKSGAMKRVFSMIMTGQFDTSNDKARLADEIFRNLMNKESAIGSSLIPMPSTVSRQEFFLSDSHPNEWFYHAQSLMQPAISRSIRYLVSEPDGIYKSIDGGQYSLLKVNELSDFLKLTNAYSTQLMSGPYKNMSRSDFSLAA